MAKKKFHISYGIIHIILILLAAVCIIPLLLVVGISFTDEQSLMSSGYNLIPKVFSLDAYKYVFTGAVSVGRAYLVTIVVTVAGTAGHLLFMSMLAYGLTREEVTARNKISFFVYLPVLFNAGLVPTYMLFTRTLHLKNTIWVLILISIASSTNVLILKNFFSTIPKSLIESARIDGSSEFRTFFTIVLPLSKPSLASIGLFVAIAYWNDWLTCSLYIETPKLQTLQYLLQSLMNNIAYLQANAGASASLEAAIANLPSESARMATCVLAVGPIIFLYPFLQKYFEKGLTIGAVKE
ncbi:carbohydrate ABC transporter permease [Mediterraneibacter glycyrrhizinilyticus]|uniref:carbohydrate ABC transporter permease n=1 Tax=Mediterraneibacter glycyrrhizinilyticus TaxID=342942 RepID=UPI0025AAF7D8|nr:carbohydrate ABC transporter permease [Mediterraneibacter glycyrrhizinilyticus]MDN0044718.1 carbohydrate ABC transporter permease [Mediterraneibacter glycyrrhizinilyticus]